MILRKLIKVKKIEWSDLSILEIANFFFILFRRNLSMNDDKNVEIY